MTPYREYHKYKQDCFFAGHFSLCDDVLTTPSGEICKRCDLNASEVTQLKDAVSSLLNPMCRIRTGNGKYG